MTESLSYIAIAKGISKLEKGKAEVDTVRFLIKDLATRDIESDLKKKIEELYGGKNINLISALDDDLWSFTFSIDFLYLGGVDKLLLVVEKLLDKGYPLVVNTEELTKGKCLIQDVFLKIERVEEKLRGRKI